MPDASLLVNFNRFILAFWMAERGAVDNAQMWEWMDAGERQKVGLYRGSELKADIRCSTRIMLPVLP
jgi:hypothetical protein